jgi:CHAT domain-containing protein
MTRVLAYAVSLTTIRAVDIYADSAIDLRLCPTGSLLDDFDALMSELNTPALLSRSTWPQLERFASGWGRSLLPPSWLADPPDAAVFVPHGFLHELPLHLVRTDSGNPLCVDSVVSVSSSLSALRSALQRSTSLGVDFADQFLAVRRERARRTNARVRRIKPAGGTRVDTIDASYIPTGRRWLAAGVDALGANDDVWRALPAELLQVLAPHEDLSTIVATDQSLRDVVTKRLIGQRYELVVLAAHGYRNPLDALDGGLVMRSAREPRALAWEPIFGRAADSDNVPYVFQDLPTRDLPPELSPSLPAELLSIAELERTRAHLDCPLVLLLGCSTGRPVIHAGDQPQSLAEIFLRIGAATVVAPMWGIRVSIAREWATQFLQGLDGRTARGRGDASRRASRTLHESGAPLQDVACMVLHGDYR